VDEAGVKIVKVTSNNEEISIESSPKKSGIGAANTVASKKQVQGHRQSSRVFDRSTGNKGGFNHSKTVAKAGGMVVEANEYEESSPDMTEKK